jgi:hypothetical protein
VQVLQIAAQLKLLKLGTIALEGTKVHANASRHSALSYGRASQLPVDAKQVEPTARARVRHHQTRDAVQAVLVTGLEKTTGEWQLVTLAYNFRRLHVLKA